MMIQKRELSRIALMIDSDDKEIRSLASSILLKKSKFRLNLSVIVFIHLLAFVLSIFLINYFFIKQVNQYILPIVITLMLQLGFSINYITSLGSYRRIYNESVKKYL